MKILDTGSELWSTSVSGGTNGKVNHPKMYFHFFCTQKNLVKRDQRMQNIQLCAVTDLLKHNNCRTVYVGHLPLTDIIRTHLSQRYKQMLVLQHNATCY
jgi:hypothetical protein